MYMKKYLLILLIVCLGAGMAFSQDIDQGQKLMYYQKWESAENTFEKVLDTDPSNVEAYYWLTKVLTEQGDLEEARKVQQRLDAYVASSGEDKIPLNSVSDGEILLREGKTQQAKGVFGKVLNETRYKKPEVMIAVAQAYLDSKSTNYDEILELLVRAEKRSKKNPEISMLRGEVYRRLNDGGKAVQAYMQALERDNSNAEALYSIGKIYLTQQNPEMYLKYFNEAIAKDPAYAPAYYEIFYHYYFRDVNKAREYLDKYIANTEPSVENDYLVTDFLYASSKHQEAIQHAKMLLDKEKENAKPRLLKLIAYSYDALGDSSLALQYLNSYFEKEADSNYVAKDYELKAKLLSKFPGNTAEVVSNLQHAMDMDTVSENKAEYAAQIANIYKELNDRSSEAQWLGKVYALKKDPTNLDLYYWGVAHYSASEYAKADSVFAIYTEKHPEHIHGFYWRAKSNALIDSTMENGLAIPFYQKVIEMGLADTAANKSLLIQGYGYLGAYHANIKKDYALALENFDRILQLDAGNDDAIRYREILLKHVNAETGN
jgi:cytochrome c-type biogenesis protein CcmH/NrfG